jgi:hypothetical protein
VSSCRATCSGLIKRAAYTVSALTAASMPSFDKRSQSMTRLFAVFGAILLLYFLTCCDEGDHRMTTSDVHWRKVVASLLVWITLLVAAGCVTSTGSHSDTAVMSQVVRLKRGARCSTDDGTVAQFEDRDVLPPGSLVETPFDDDAYVDIALGRSSLPTVIRCPHQAGHKVGKCSRSSFDYGRLRRLRSIS